MTMDMTASLARIDAKLCGAVERKMGLDAGSVTISYRLLEKSGATVPVFTVPSGRQSDAVALGLTVVA